MNAKTRKPAPKTPDGARVEKNIYKRGEKTGIEDLRIRDLRHEATSRLFEKGVFDSMEVASITGHKTLQMLKRYTHLLAEDLAKKLGVEQPPQKGVTTPNQAPCVRSD